jgi:hypothetical protein
MFLGFVTFYETLWSESLDVVPKDFFISGYCYAVMSDRCATRQEYAIEGVASWWNGLVVSMGEGKSEPKTFPN